VMMSWHLMVMGHDPWCEMTFDDACTFSWSGMDFRGTFSPFYGVMWHLKAPLHL
jgi:hypothetical protein